MRRMFRSTVAIDRTKEMSSSGVVEKPRKESGSFITVDYRSWRANAQAGPPLCLQPVTK
jgi:hypothetical protein